MSTIRLSFAGGPWNMRRAMGKDRTGERVPAALISYYSWGKYNCAKLLPELSIRDYALDSGAYSVRNSGGEVDIDAYIDFAKERLATDPLCTEVFSLDVIGDWRQTLKNTEYMWKQGVPAIPCYHYGEPWDALRVMKRDYPGKIAIGGAANIFSGARKMNQAIEIFARAWPARMHGFGFGSEKALHSLPWHSTDATNWMLGPLCFGRYTTYGPLKLRGGNRSLLVEVNHFIEIEKKAQYLWRKQMAELDKECGEWPLRSC